MAEGITSADEQWVVQDGHLTRTVQYRGQNLQEAPESKSNTNSQREDESGARAHLGVPPLLTLDADWLREVRKQLVEFL